MFVITAKEIRLLLRSRRAFGFLLAALLVLGGVFCLAWADMSRSEYYTVGSRSRMGREFFSIISLVLLCAMGLIAPLTAATAVSGEREAGTLDLLFCTGLRRLNILLGKWAATVYYEFIVLVCSLPVLALVFQLGGVGFDEYLFSALMIAAVVLAYGMLGLACSCLFRRSAAALAAALLSVLFLSGGLPLFMIFLDSSNIIDIGHPRGSDRLNFGTALYWSVSPLVGWIHRQESIQSNTALFKDPVFIAHLGFQLMLFAVALLVARQAFARLGADGTGKTLDKLAETAQRRRWPFLRFMPQLLSVVRFVLRPFLRRRPQRIPDGCNPIHARARSVHPWRRLLPQMGVFCVPIALMLTDAWDRHDSENFVLGSVFFAITLVGLFTPIFAATAIARERDEKTMDLLRVTPLGAGAIVRGKFFAALRPLLAIAFMAVLVPLLWRGFYTLDRSMQYGRGLVAKDEVTEFLFPAGWALLLLLVFSALYAAVGILVSTYQRRGAGAMTLAYIVLFVIAVIGPFVLAFIVYEVGNEDWGIAEPLRYLLKCVANFVSPLLSPFYYMTMTDSDVRHAYVFWKDPAPGQVFWLMLWHAGLVLALAGLALRSAARRLARE